MRVQHCGCRDLCKNCKHMALEHSSRSPFSDEWVPEVCRKVLRPWKLGRRNASGVAKVLVEEKVCDCRNFQRD